MFTSPLFSAVPSGVLDMTADFTPFFVGLVILLGISALGVVAAIAIHDTWWTKRPETRVPSQPALAPDLPKAA